MTRLRLPRILRARAHAALALGAVVLVAASALVLVLALDARDAAPAAPLDVRTLVGGPDTAGFRRALAPREFAFPRDHGPHDGFRTEWWYFTGNLEDTSGRRFGYQLTFFRSALAARPPARESPWAASHAFMAHFAVADESRGRFHAAERFARGALDLAGAEIDPLSVWTGQWRMDALPSGAFRIRAQDADIALDVVLRPLRKPVLQGDRGLSRKSGDSGNASYYYSLTRLSTRGTLNVSGRSHVVDGLSWMDREWSTSALAADQIGWDWIALHFEDGRDLMFYRLRQRGGGIAPQSTGSIVHPDGRTLTLRSTDVRWDVLDTWLSATGARYPARWRLRIPIADIDVEITPLLADQELDLAVRYWEGAVVAEGTASGRGYLELTGYDARRSGTRAAPELNTGDSTTYRR